jgi:hypothetical protein
MTRQMRINLSWAAVCGSLLFSALLVASAFAAAKHVSGSVHAGDIPTQESSIQAVDVHR